MRLEPELDIPTAATVDLGGHRVVRHYGDTRAEYAALRGGAMLVDRSHRARARFAGGKASDVLTGLVTSDVKALTPGHGQYAAALTPKGKIIADVRIFARDADLLVDVPARAAPGWWAMVHKYVNPRLAAYTDETDQSSDIGVFGAGARRAVSRALAVAEESLAALPAHAHLTVESAAGSATVVATPELGFDGFDVLVPRGERTGVWRRLADAGAVPAGLDAWEIARIEAGRPEWGLDIDETTLAQEANLDELHAISYTKGCYTGQETVARVHFRGHVNRHLRGLRFSAESVLPAGVPLVGSDEAVVGEVRSSAHSPRLGGVALGMVRREVALASTVRARWEGGDVPVTVLALPFPL